MHTTWNYMQLQRHRYIPHFTNLLNTYKSTNNHIALTNWRTIILTTAQAKISMFTLVVAW
jgi:hypothetical protein